MNFKLIFAGVFSVFAACAQAKDLSEHTSEDGHNFSFIHMPNADRVAISIAWIGGYANVAPGQENLPAMTIDLMLSGGADGRSPDDIRAEFEAMDAGSHLYSDTDAIRGFVVAPAKDLQTAAKIANSVLARPSLDERWFKRFVRNAKKNTTEGMANNARQAWNTIRHVTMGGHRLEQAWSWQPVGSLDTLTIEDARQWYAAGFSSTDLVISVAGNGTAEEIGKALDTTLKGLPTSHARVDLEPLEMTYSGKTIVIHRPDQEKSYMAIVGALPPAEHPDKLALMLGAGVLGQSEQSRLFKAVRGELRATYGFGAQIYAFTRAQDQLALSGEVETAKLADTLQAIEQTYNTFRDGGVGRLEFPFAKRIMLKRIVDNMRKPSSVAHVMTEAFFEDKDILQATNLEDQADDLSRGDVNRAIAEHFPDFTEMVKVIVTPDAEAVAADCVITSFAEASACK